MREPGGWQPFDAAGSGEVVAVVAVPGRWAPEPDSVHLICSKIRTLERVVIGFHEGGEWAGGEVQLQCGIGLVVVDGTEPVLC